MRTPLRARGFVAFAIISFTSTAARAQDMPGMTMPAAPLGIAMERQGSGTTWTPDAIVLPSKHFAAGEWSMMVHGFGFLQQIKQGGDRGAEQFGSLNWAMLMATRDVSGGRFQLRTMLSVDPATIKRAGYPLLLQSGERYRGQPIVDRQHPHDAFMEVAAMYERAVGERIGLSAYVAAAGEPALGAVAFMHRQSGMDNLFAPLGHHWQDATHITFGTATLGVFGKKWKLEASAFNGREPDDQRWNIDLGALDSYSGRVTLNPTANWSMTAGYGYLHEPEAAHPGESARRVVASILYGRALTGGGQLAASAVLGTNWHGGDEASNSLLLEAQTNMGDANTWLARAEWAQKSPAELGVVTGDVDHHGSGVKAISAGYIRELGARAGMTLGIGAIGTVNFVPESLRAAYGSRMPLGGGVFLRLRPTGAPRDAHAGHPMPH